MIATPATRPAARVSPLAPAAFPALAPIAGVRVATAAAGVHYRERTDVMMAALDPGASVAGVFTTSRTSAAPVAWCRRILGGGGARGLVVNAGNANVFTGRDGAVAVARHRRRRRQRARLRARRGVRRLDRGDRRQAAL